MARDRFLPQQFTNVGDRLVFSNGILLLAFFSALLAWVFKGDTSRLIPLYAVGVFLSFTLSQSGMVRHWWRAGKRGEGNWRRAIVINGLGALATALVLLVFLLTKFIHAHWIVVVIVPLLVLTFKAIHHYYSGINAQNATRRHFTPGPPAQPRDHPGGECSPRHDSSS